MVFSVSIYPSYQTPVGGNSKFLTRAGLLIDKNVDARLHDFAVEDRGRRDNAVARCEHQRLLALAQRKRVVERKRDDDFIPLNFNFHVVSPFVADSLYLKRDSHYRDTIGNCQVTVA